MAMAIVNRKRIGEWWRTICVESGAIGLSGRILFALMLVRFVFSPITSRSKWRRRMRTCANCHVYAPSTKRCRPFTGSDEGCGCYMPFKAAVKNAKCWLGQNKPWEGGWHG